MLFIGKPSSTMPRKLMTLSFAVCASFFLFAGAVDAATYYVSPSGNGTDPTTWAGAWSSLSAVQWGSGANEVNAGDILTIDEGRYEEPLIVGESGSPGTEISIDSYATLQNQSNADLASDGWIVITAGASDGTLNESARISGGELQGKAGSAYEGTTNSGFALTSSQTNTYEVVQTETVTDVFECDTTDLTTQDACVLLTSRGSIGDTESNAGSYYYDSSGNKLHIHATDSSNVSTSTTDYIAIRSGVTDNYTIDIEGIDGVVFDGGANQRLEFTFGESDVANGVVKSDRSGSNTIFRNLKMLYADGQGHVAHFEMDKLLFSDSIVGKAVGNQSISHSLISNDIHGFVIDNTIWDAWEQHGNVTYTNPTEDYVVSGNTFKHELLNGVTDIAVLKFQTFSVNDGGTLLITNNTFDDGQETLNDNAISLIGISDNQVDGTGTVTISNNTLSSTGLTATASTHGINYNPTNEFASAVITGNTISGHINGTSQTGILVQDGTDGLEIASNTLTNNTLGIYLLGAGTGIQVRNNSITSAAGNANSFGIFGAEDGATGFTIEGNAFFSPVGATANRMINLQTMTGTNTIRHNYFEDKAASILFLNQDSVGTFDIYGNVFNNGDYGVRIFNVDAGTINIYNNTFYSNIYGIDLDSGSGLSNAVNVQNNIFVDASSWAVRDNTTATTLNLDYNIWDNNTSDVTTEGTTPSAKGSSAVDADPLFIDAGSDDFSLQVTSPAVDAGTQLSSTYRYGLDPDASWPSSVRLLDQNGFGTGWDIGAYVYLFASSSSGSSPTATQVDVTPPTCIDVDGSGVLSVSLSVPGDVEQFRFTPYDSADTYSAWLDADKVGSVTLKQETRETVTVYTQVLGTSGAVTNGPAMPIDYSSIPVCDDMQQEPLDESNEEGDSSEHGDTNIFDQPTEARSPLTGEVESVDQVSVGDYIRSRSYAAVYYIDVDGTRRPFWNDQIYFTYQDSFDAVVTVTDATLQTIPLGEPMSPNPGVVLIKVPTVASVYALEVVEGVPTLRHIASEEDAQQLYGDAWADYVIDIDQIWFTRFMRGDVMDPGADVDRSRLKTRVELAEKSA